MTDVEERKLDAQARKLVKDLNLMIAWYRAGDTDGKALRLMLEMVCPEAIPDLFPESDGKR